MGDGVGLGVSVGVSMGVGVGVSVSVRVRVRVRVRVKAADQAADQATHLADRIFHVLPSVAGLFVLQEPRRGCPCTGVEHRLLEIGPDDVGRSSGLHLDPITLSWGEGTNAILQRCRKVRLAAHLAGRPRFSLVTVACLPCHRCCITEDASDPASDQARARA